MIEKTAALIPKDVIERVKKLNVPLLCDGIGKAGLDLPNGGCMEADIMPVARGMIVVGTALTVDTDNGDNFPIHLASYCMDSAEGYVMVISGKGYKERAYLGDLIMGSCQAVGFEGIVVDGLTRDRDGNIDDLHNYPVYSKGFSPRGPIKKNEGKVNSTVICGGVKVAPGDLVMGDSDGVVVVPRDLISIVLEKAEEKLAYENNRTATIAAYRKAKKEGTEKPNLAPQWVVDMLKK